MEVNQQVQKRKIGSVDGRIVLEASIIGLMLVVVMSVIAVIMKQPIPSIVLMFLTGVAVHLGCEFSGINQYYVDFYK